MTKDVIINKIINQANSLNKKIKTFKNEGILDHYDFVTSMFNDKQMKYNKSGSLTKSKKYYEKQNILQLKRTLNVLTKINNHDTFGTVRKYRKVATEKWQTLTHTVKTELIGKGYSEEYVNAISTSSTFQNSLFNAFKEMKEGYGSEQIIEKVFLNYNKNNMSKEEINKRVSNIEYSVSKHLQLQKEIDEYREYQEWKRNKNKR